jgi:hypothetical protein
MLTTTSHRRCEVEEWIIKNFFQAVQSVDGLTLPRGGAHGACIQTPDLP